MKKVFLILLTLLIVLILSCTKTTESDNTLPTVVITYPVNNSEFIQGEIITITADAQDDEGVEKVEFYIDGTKVSTDLTEPYEYEWDTGIGKDINYSLYAEAFDTSNNSSNSESIHVTVNEYGTVTDVDGNVYKTLVIGNHEWMMENLKVTHYRNGDTIPHLTDNGDWTSTYSSAYCVFDNDSSNTNTYGNLYNWYAVDESCGLAPEGWHVPTDDEWQTLVDYLGGSSVAGGKMKETDTAHWNSPNTGATNESGFTALPGGYRSGKSGNFGSIGYYAYFWSSTEHDSNYAWGWLLYYYYSAVYRNGYDKKCGFSIRCLRD